MRAQLLRDPVDVFIEARVADAQRRALVEEVVPRRY